MVESQLVRTMTDPNMGSAWAGFLLPALQEEVGSEHSLRQSLGLDVWPSAVLAAGHTSCSGSVWVTGAGASYQPDCCSGWDGLVSILGPYVVQVGVLVGTAQQAAKGRGHLADLSVLSEPRFQLLPALTEALGAAP